MISGKRCVISSSPRDQRWVFPPRVINCARMPSHFHSTCQSRRSPSASTSPSSGDARLNGYGLERSSSVCSGESTRSNHSAVGVHHHGAVRLRSAARAARQRRRTDDERLGHLDAEFPGQQFEEDETLDPVERRAPLEHAPALFVGIRVAERKDAPLDPFRERQELVLVVSPQVASERLPTTWSITNAAVSAPSPTTA